MAQANLAVSMPVRFLLIIMRMVDTGMALTMAAEMRGATK